MTEEQVRRIIREELQRIVPVAPFWPTPYGIDHTYPTVCPGCKPGQACSNAACPLLPRIT